MARPRYVHTFILAVALLLVASVALAQGVGRIDGRVTRADGDGLGGVIVRVDQLDTATLTENDGTYTLTGLPAGTYSLSFALDDRATTQAEVVVTAGQATRVDKVVDWNVALAAAITVSAASRRAERLVEAPAAVTVAAEEDIQAVAPSGQAPRIIESAPGVDFTQSGLYDFNFNTRGFNSSLNRRILTLIDGRDPSVPFLGAQEWAALSFPIDEMASVELVRGPGSALYGANAFSGVLNMTTKQPRDSTGGRLMLTGGDLNTRRGDFRHAGGLGAEWYYRVTGGWQESDDFTRSRNAGAEYSDPNGRRPPTERVPLALTEAKVRFAGLRLDKHFGTGPVLTVEGGYATLEGPTFQTGIGRVQVTDVDHPWARINLNTIHWNVLAYYDSRNANNQIALASGAGLYEQSTNLHGEIQTNWSFLQDKFRVVGGVAYNQQDVDTTGPNGLGTLMVEPKEEEQQSAFGQLEWNVTNALKLVGAARWDDSTLHESQFSPKGAIVYSFNSNHSVRLGYNEAFQRPNYSELFLQAPAGAPVNLSQLEAAFRPLLGTVQLGFGAVPILALGNSALEVEQVRSHEIGYSGIFAGKLFVTIDYYQSHLSDFVTDLLPAVNPAFRPYQVPAGVNPAVAAQIIGTLRQALPVPPAAPFPLFAAMTNLPNGAPAFVISYTNAGEVDTQGLELAGNYYISNNWLIDANYTWFDFDVQEQQLGDLLLPNAPEHKANIGLGYRGLKFDAKATYRWVDEFPWAAGVFSGLVPQYDVVNLSANYRFTDTFGFGLDVSNALDNVHYEAFGGDLLERRALAFFSVSW